MNCVKNCVSFLVVLCTVSFSLFAQPSKPEASRYPSGPFSDSLPLRRVVLYSNGTTYFEREVQVSGSGGVDLYFRSSDIDDLLKSLVILDPGRDIPPSVSYGSRDPLDRILKSFSIDLSRNPTLASLLLQARGEGVELWAGERIQGTLMGTETRAGGGAPLGEGSEEAAGDTSYPPTLYVQILSDQGMKSIPYERITTFRFLNPNLMEELAQALRYIRENRNTDKKRVTLSYSGSGNRVLRVGYILESPVWKTAFRLVLGEGQKHLLQGWGIVENSTDEDWKEVRMDLVSGQPISFTMNLYEPIYNPRPKVPYTVERQLPPPVYSSGVAPAPAASPETSSPSLKRSKANLASEAMADKSLASSLREEGKPASEAEGFLSPEVLGTSSMAEASSVGQFIRYTLQDPVTIPRRQAALLPILNASIEGERVSIYNEGTNRKRPLRGIWIRNTTGLALMGGPMTVFEAGQYAGDARIDTVSAGDRRLLSYAVDLDMEVLFLDNSLPETITRIRINKGNLLVSKIQRKERTYTLVNRGNTPRTLLIEHPTSAGYTLIEPASFEERTEAYYRFRKEVPAQARSGLEFRVIEEKPLESTVALSTLQSEGILFYLNQRSLNEKVREALSKVLSLRNELSQASRTRGELENQIAQITRDQERIRSNMGVLDRTSSLYQRYLKTLGEQEDTLAEAQQKLSDARKQEALKRKALEDSLATLEVE
ncbi:MAG: hypothetical protein N2442_04880 [Spirochaetes bacterium]|nr:hypothetical protein [Spirochaetota bacterium]